MDTLPAPLYPGPSATEPVGPNADPTAASEARHTGREWVEFFGKLVVVLTLGAVTLYVAVRMR